MDSNHRAEEHDRLESWKHIANYLGCSIRTAQRRAKNGMPVHRHEATGCVWAYKSQLDAWFALLSQKEKRESERQSDSGLANAGLTEPPMKAAHPEPSPAKKPHTSGWSKPRAASATLIIGIVAPLLFTWTTAYGLSILGFGISVVSVIFLYQRQSGTLPQRLAVAVFIIAAMSYALSASTLRELDGVIVNITTLQPALAYPFITGLRFLPSFVLVFAFWVILARYGDAGFARYPFLGKAYTGVGVVFLFVTGLSSVANFGDYRIWQAGLPGSGVLVVGYLVVLAENGALWLVGRKFFRAAIIPNYGQLFLFCAILYLPLTVAAAFIDSDYNWINKYHLDKRRPDTYVVRNPEAIREFRGRQSNTIGQDLANLLADPEFEQTLRTKQFFKQDFDEPFQVLEHAVMFGYRADARGGEAARFIIIRFPEELATALRFDLIGPATSASLH